MIIRDDDGVWVVLRETIACHHEEAFACLTTADGLSRWFPVGARVDLRIGGNIVLSWDPHFRRTTTITILGYDPGGWIVWDWLVGAGDFHAPVYWKVEPSVEEGSRIELRQGPFKEDVDSLMAMAEEAETWRWQLCNLRSVLEVSLDMRKVRPL
jgi:uncharacterized protein YndB with AHSA1/START domain